MRLGCHAVLFKDQIATATEALLSQIKATGFSGTEIGARFFGTQNKEDLTEALRTTEMVMSGMHTVVMLTDLLDKKEDVAAAFLKVVEFVKDMAYPNVVLTGLHKMPIDSPDMDERLSDPDQVAQIARGLNELALRAKSLGVRVHYHNHAWEFDNDALIFNSIGEHAPDMNFGLDTGWAFYSGYDPVKLMEQYPNRFHYVHLRDFNKKTKAFVDLGNGDMEFKRLSDKLKEILGPEDWAIVEYETGESDIERYKAAHAFIQPYFI